MEVTQCVCPPKALEMVLHISASQIQTVLSYEPKMTGVPSFENATELTRAITHVAIQRTSDGLASLSTAEEG